MDEQRSLDFEIKIIKKSGRIDSDRIKTVAKFHGERGGMMSPENPKRPMGFRHLGSSPFCEGRVIMFVGSGCA